MRVHPYSVAHDDARQLVTAVGMERHGAGGLGRHVGRMGVDAHDPDWVGHLVQRSLVLRGSNASRRPSPTKFTARTNVTVKMPAGTHWNGSRSSVVRFRASFNM